MTLPQKTIVLQAISQLGVKRPGQLYNLIYNHIKTHGSETITETMLPDDPFAKHFDQKKMVVHSSPQVCLACEG